jgi:hypothetical protein
VSRLTLFLITTIWKQHEDSSTGGEINEPCHAHEMKSNILIKMKDLNIYLICKLRDYIKKQASVENF